MLTLDFCDYNNLISELLEEELRHYDSKYIPKSPHLIIGKLEIFKSIFEDFDEASREKILSNIERAKKNLSILKSHNIPLEYFTHNFIDTPEE